jgi:hypothetical protein
MVGTVVFGGAGAVLGQEAPPASHPSHIHPGTCAELDPNPAAPLNNIVPIGVDPEDAEAEVPQAVGALTASPILYAASEEVELTWDDMLAESHALNVHLSDEEIQTYIACGDIGGTPTDDDSRLVIALHPQNDSGYTGIAILQKDDDDNVDVEVYLAAPAGEQPIATPAA